MRDQPNNDNLTSFEKRAYRLFSYVALAGVVACILVVRQPHTEEAKLVINIVGFVCLIIGVIFGWGYNKDIRVLDLRKYNGS
ncbi:hypothetical protein AX768_08490 [Burkholderia sp. PAMC 28687]|uniref:hypothetical protein n=1 Tax=Burkholderia sp. PAMC 28687 TaxID=1795874 RepID=UPI0007849E57|nr:hypothetical protein [Burkholderia sp. PAMC 28687]AMM14130.1 hypothetical protein AX768_08490 [Burkholderia sp. PAMC 28687]